MVATIEWHQAELFPPVGFIVTNLGRPARRGKRGVPGAVGSPFPGQQGPRRARFPRDARARIVEKPGAKRAWRCTMALHRSAAESGKVIWEMWVQWPSLCASR